MAIVHNIHETVKIRIVSTCILLSAETMHAVLNFFLLQNCVKMEYPSDVARSESNVAEPASEPGSPQGSPQGAQAFPDEVYRHMRAALEQAEFALADGEVPVGCIFVRDGRVISCGYNLTNKLKNGTMHAEVVSINRIIQKSELDISIIRECDLYVTCEPCIMVNILCCHCYLFVNTVLFTVCCSFVCGGSATCVFRLSQRQIRWQRQYFKY